LDSLKHLNGIDGVGCGRTGEDGSGDVDEDQKSGDDEGDSSWHSVRRYHQTHPRNHHKETRRNVVVKDKDSDLLK